jgi:plasmid stabilization system protein ParE
MTRRLIVRPAAQVDIEEAAFWYESRRPGLGGGFTDQLDQLFQRIAAGPFQFPEVGQGVRRGLLHRFPYAVYFDTSETIIAVIAVLHQHRHPDTWRQRK